MMCKNCNKRIRKDTPVCPHCGTPQTETVSLSAMNAAGKKERRSMTKGRRLAVLFAWGGALLLVAAAVLLLPVYNVFSLGFFDRLFWCAGTVLAVLGAVLVLTGLVLTRPLWVRILAIVMGGILLLASLLPFFGRDLLSEFIDKNTSQGPTLIENELGVNNVLPKTGVLNIALFGLDNRTDTDDGRSDAILILSVDRDHNKIKLTSIARDTLANVKDYGWNNNSREDDWTKLTHAFYYGAHSTDETKSGPSVAVRALNENFNLNITKYAYVNFHEFAKIIDLIGGVEIEVEERELNQLNKHIRGMVSGSGMDIQQVPQAGKQTLTGGQALAYARIRKIDSDIKRGDRQKAVIDAVLNKARSMSVLEYPSLIQEALGICNTNLTGQEILEIAEWVLDENPETVNYSIPDDDATYCWDSYSSKGSATYQRYGAVYVMDLDYVAAYLHDFIYETATADPEQAQKLTAPQLPIHLQE